MSTISFDWVGLIWELALWSISVYLLLFGSGIIAINPDHQPAAARFRDQNKKWLVPLAFVMVILMSLNLLLRFFNS